MRNQLLRGFSAPFKYKKMWSVSVFGLFFRSWHRCWFVVFFAPLTVFILFFSSMKGKGERNGRLCKIFRDIRTSIHSPPTDNGLPLFSHCSIVHRYRIPYCSPLPYPSNGSVPRYPNFLVIRCQLSNFFSLSYYDQCSQSCVYVFFLSSSFICLHNSIVYFCSLSVCRNQSQQQNLFNLSLDALVPILFVPL